MHATEGANAIELLTKALTTDNHEKYTAETAKVSGSASYRKIYCEKAYRVFDNHSAIKKKPN